MDKRRRMSLMLVLVAMAPTSSLAVRSSTSENQSSYSHDMAQEYCLMETFQPRCTHGDVIAMTTAQFGRMRVGRCIKSDALQLQHPDSLGCSADVMGYFDRVCSGKSSCDVFVPNPDLFSYRPCSEQLSMYLEASYVCVSVVDEDRSCSISAVVGSPIYVSSSAKDQRSDRRDASSGCGSRSNPWIIEAQTGQQINISLLDFGQQSRSDVIGGQTAAVDRDDRRVDNCVVQYGYIVDKAAAAVSSRKNTTICASDAGLQRDRFVYQSKGSAVEIVLSSVQSSQDIKHKFLLGFEAVGCSNLVPPSDAWLRRTDNEATVGCYTTRQRWHLRCQAGQWKGALGQCADSELIEDSTAHIAAMASVHVKNSSFINILSVVAVSFIGLAICLIIVFVGIGCNRRYQRQLGSVKSGQYPTMPITQMLVHKTFVGGGQDNENTAFRSTDGRHQYFILDRDHTRNDASENALA